MRKHLQFALSALFGAFAMMAPAIPALAGSVTSSATQPVVNDADLAKARAAAMKALIQKDPASALREALPAGLRASLPKPIAAAIEQPVRKTGMCSLRIMCNHAFDAPHGECQETPVLLENLDSWNTCYGTQQ